MKLWLCTHVYDDPMLPYWLRHHRTFCDRLLVWLNGDTPERETAHVMALCEQYGAQVNRFPFSGLADDRYVSFAEKWIENLADADEVPDRVGWDDCDEFYFCKDWQAILEAYKTAPILRGGVGWSMYHPSFPTTAGQIYEEVRHGLPELGAAKPVFCLPGTNPRWSAGKHEAYGAPVVVLPEIMGCHFRKLGVEHLVNRNTENWKRVTAVNKALGHGYHTNEENTAKEPPIFEADLAKAMAAPEVELFLEKEGKHD